MGEKRKDFCGINFVGRRLLLGSMDPASTKSKSWSDKIVWKQVDVSLGFPSINKFSETTAELASTPNSSNCFLIPNLLSYSVCWEDTLQYEWSDIGEDGPFFNRYVKATMLSSWRWMALCFKDFKNVCIESFMVESSITFMWFFISWVDHIPLLRFHCTLPPAILLRYRSVLTPLQVVD